MQTMLVEHVCGETDLNGQRPSVVNAMENGLYMNRCRSPAVHLWLSAWRSPHLICSFVLKMRFALRSILAGTGLLSVALAVTPISDSSMTDLLNAGGVDLAYAAAPMWFFGQALNQPPCYPTNATNGQGQQTPSVGLCNHPNVGCNCRQPGVGITNPGPPFPVYYSYQKCNAGEIRIAYNLFYEKDGVNPEGTFGHR